ncbi:hypothetical protein EJ07DRAFT_155767 [Lizonia empirigonia]|nr:hypothetical protein EJ07DRAFT_155767 [Lizonia empirigonia]
MALGKRKRDDMSSVVGTKRRRISTEYPQLQERFSFTFNIFSNMNDVDSMRRHLPAPKPKPSPLLLLPAELRTRIWEYAYGNLHIAVNLCSLHKPAEASHNDLTFTILKDHTNPWSPPPQRACKQLYSKATTAFHSPAPFPSPHPPPSAPPPSRRTPASPNRAASASWPRTPLGNHPHLVADRQAREPERRAHDAHLLAVQSRARDPGRGAAGLEVGLVHRQSGPAT